MHKKRYCRKDDDAYCRCPTISTNGNDNNIVSTVFSELADRNEINGTAFNTAYAASFVSHLSHPLHQPKTTHAKIVVTWTNKKTFDTHSDIQLCCAKRVVFLKYAKCVDIDGEWYQQWNGKNVYNVWVFI